MFWSVSQHGFEPFNDSLYVDLHVLYLLAPQLQSDFGAIAVGHFLGEFTEDLTLNVFLNFVIFVATLLETVEQVGVVTAQEDDQLEPTLGEEVAAVELEDDATLLAHHGLQLVAHHILIKLWHIELFIPSFVKLLRLNEVG